MEYSSLVNRINTADDAEGDPWAIHEMAYERSANGEDIIMLSIGQEADEVTPDIVVQSAITSLEQGDHHYSVVQGSPELLQSIAKYHHTLTGQSVNAENCTVYAGAQNALFATALVLLEKDDEVIVSEPYYTTYAATFSCSGATLVSVPVTREYDYQLRTDDIIVAVNSRTRAIVLNSPNNPMGTCYSAEDFAAILRLCVEKKIWLILDSVYLDIVSVDKAVLPHTLPGANDVLITIGSLSKSHRMTGWRLGWAVAPAPMAEHLANLSMCMHYGLPPFVMKAAQTAIEQSTKTPMLVRDTLQRRRSLASPILQNLQGATLHDSGQGMFMLLDVTALQVTAHTFSLTLLDNYQVAVLPCDGFGQAGKYLVRIGLCVDDAKLEKACRQIVACVAEYRAAL